MWARSPGTLWRQCLDGTLVLTADAARPVLLTGWGQVIWSLLDEPSDSTDLLALLAHQLPDADRAVVTTDLEGFLDDLVGCGAVVRR